MKVFSKEIGFYEIYFDSDDDSFKVVIKMWCFLSTVPVDEVHNAVDELTPHTLILFPETTNFILYFTRTWTGLRGSDGGRFKLRFWNIRDR